MALQPRTIVAGPGEMDLMFSLFSRGGRDRFPVTFELQDDNQSYALTQIQHKFILQVCITMLKQVVGEEHKWCFEAYLTLSRDNFFAPKGVTRVKGTYSTATRTGELEFTE